mgnify:CR=1 FL=1
MDSLDCGIFDVSLSAKYILDWKCIKFYTFPFPEDIRIFLEKAQNIKNNDIPKIDKELGFILYNYIKNVLITNRVDLIALHGHTIKHKDGDYSIQVGSPKYIYKNFKIPLVYNFRKADIESGGNGAPLMPFLDWLIFKNNKHNIITLNLGGVANISYVPIKGHRKDVLGFDTGPGMGLIDEACRIYLNKNLDMDGEIANCGKIDRSLLNQLLSHPYILKTPPKSTGRDIFGSKLIKNIQAKYIDIRIEDLLRTLCFFTAKTISRNLKYFININKNNDILVISGGGVKHPVVMNDIHELVKVNKIELSDKYGISSKMKECLLMAILGVAKIKNISANMSSVTGSNGEIVLGEIYKN